MTRNALFLFFFFGAIGLQAQDLGQSLTTPAPGTATIFAPGLISDGLNNRDFTLSPEGNEIFYTVQSAKFLKSVIIHLKKSNGTWSAPEIAPFSGKYRDLEAFFAPDGKSIFFSSDRPLAAGGAAKDFDIWKTERTASGWSEPVNLGEPVNSPKNEFYPSLARNGSLYLTAEVTNGYGEEDIVRCRFENGKFQPRELLDTAVNTKGDEFNAFVDPDERFLIFSSYKGRTDELGGGDLYISRKDASGKWRKAVNLGPAVNSAALDYCPFVSADGQKLYFASNRQTLSPATSPASYAELRNRLLGAGNSFDDVYVVRLTLP